MKKHNISWGVLLLVLLLWLPVLLNAQVIDGVLSEGEYPNVARIGGGNYTLAWEIKGDRAIFCISAKTTGWVAFGLGPTNAMEGADIVIGFVDESGRVSIHDGFAVGPFGPHPPDEELGGKTSILEYAGTETDGITTIEFSRLLGAEDAYDKPISPQGGDVYMWSYGSTDEIAVRHVERGKGVLSPGAAKPPFEAFGILLTIHLSVRSLAFAFMTSGIFIARYLKKKRWWLKIHRWFGIAGASLAVVGLVVAIFMVSARSGIHLRVAHSWFGAVTTALIIVSPLFGQTFLKVKKDLKPLYRHVHRWVGRAAILLMFGTIVLGLFQAKIL